MTPADQTDASGTALSQHLIDAGNQLEDAGDIDAALRKYQDAVAASPAYLRAYLNLGNALQRLGRTPEAIAALQTAMRIDPDYAPCHYNLGHVYTGAGELDAAERELQEALRLDPTMTDAAIALANLLDSQGRPLEAEQQLRRILAGKPGSAPAAYNLGLLLQKRNDIDQAERMFRDCLDADPSFLMACTALGDLLRNTGRSGDAEAWYRKALAANPRSQEAWSALLLSLNNRDDLSAQDVFTEHLRFGAAFPEDDSSRTARKSRNHGHSRVRVGYMSGDFIQHPVALFLRPVLAHHDRTQFELFCYSNNSTEDWMTREIRSRIDHWRNIASQGDVAAARGIRADDLDILIDLSGHSARSRILLFNHGCAPVQATWLGYLNTTGLRSVDFRICDHYTDPVGMTEHLHTERLLRLPDSQWCYSPVFDIPSMPVSRRSASDGVVFGSFNHVSKISDRCADLWSRVLHAVPASELRIVGAPPGQTTAAFHQRFEQRGIERRRISISPGMNIDNYFAAIADVDVALDPLPYNGGTTTLDVLWMEVPLVALAGDRSVSRSGVSILSTLQLLELIAASDEQYVDINRRLAVDVEWRHALRETLRARMRSSPLMDAERFTRGLESGIRRMLEGSRSS